MESPTPSDIETDVTVPTEATTGAEIVVSFQEHLSVLRRMGRYVVAELTKLDRLQQARRRY